MKEADKCRNIIQDGDIVVDNFSKATANLESRRGSVNIHQKIDDHEDPTAFERSRLRDRRFAYIILATQLQRRQSLPSRDQR
jgi:hypothetical protein